MASTEDDFEARLAARRAAREAEREKRRLEQEKEDAAYEARRKARQEKREDREQILSSAEASIATRQRDRQALSSSSRANLASSLETDESRRKEEQEAQKTRDAAKAKREAEREAQAKLDREREEQRENERNAKEEARRRKRDEEEAARVAEERRLNEEREAKRKAKEDQRQAEEAKRLAEEQKRRAEAERRAEEKRLADEQRAADEAKEKERKRLEAQQKAEAEEKRREDERKAKEEQRRLEAAQREQERIRKEEEAENARKEAAAKKLAEDKRNQEEAAAAAEAKRIADEKKKQEDEAAEAKRIADEKKKLEEAEFHRLAAAKQKEADDAAAAESKRIAEEKKKKEEEAAAAAAEAKRIADQKKKLEDEAAAAEVKRIADQKKNQEEEAALAAAEAKRIADENKKQEEEAAAAAAEAKRIADEKKKQEDEATLAAAESKRIADEKKRQEDEERAEQLEKSRKAQNEADALKAAAEAEAEVKRIADEMQKQEEEAEQARKKAAEDAKRKEQEEEDALLAADEARLKAEEEEAHRKSIEEAEEDGELKDEEEEDIDAELKRLEEEEAALKRLEEENEEAENAKLLADEEELRSLEEAPFKSTKAAALEEDLDEELRRLEAEEAALDAAEAEQQAQDANAKKEAEDAALLAEEEQLRREEAELARLEAEIKADNDRKKAAEEKIRLEEEAIAAEEAQLKQLQDQEKQAQPKKTAEDEARAKTDTPPVVPQPTALPETNITIDNTSPSQLQIDDSSIHHLAPLTQNRVKGPNRAHRATMAGLRARAMTDAVNKSIFVGELKATEFVESNPSQAEPTSSISGQEVSLATESADVSQQQQQQQPKKLPPGARGMPGMMLGDLTAAIKKSSDKRKTIAGGAAAADIASQIAAKSNENANVTVSSSSTNNNSNSSSSRIRLVQIKGKGANLQVRLVKPHYSAMSHDCAYLLDDGKSTVYLWSGSNTNKMQSTKCLDVFNRLNRSEHAGRAQSVSIKSPEEPIEFWQAMGLDDADIKSNVFDRKSSKTISQNDPNMPFVPSLYRVDPSEDNGSVSLTLITNDPKQLTKGMLWPDACYILDCGMQVHLWVGKSSPKEIRELSFSKAQSLISSDTPLSDGSQRPEWSKFIYKEAEKGESPIFTDLFSNWNNDAKPLVAHAPPSRMRSVSAAPNLSSSNNNSNSSTPTKDNSKKPSSSSPKTPQLPSNMCAWEGSVLHTMEKPASADKVLPDHGEGGSFRAWIQDGFEKKPIDNSYIGIYDDSKCYMIMYTWGLIGSERHMVYYWQGSSSSVNDQASCAGLAREINDKICKGSGTLVRITPGIETEHFLLTHSKQSKNYVAISPQKNFTTKSNKEIAVIQVRGHSDSDTKSYQIDVSSSSSFLNSNDCFLVIIGTGLDSSKASILSNIDFPQTQPENPNPAPFFNANNIDKCIIWQGKHSNSHVQEEASKLANRLVSKTKISSISEDKASNSDLSSVLPQNSLNSSSYATQKLESFELKLFMATASSTEGFKVGRIWYYTLHDICSDRVLIVEDAAHNVFVWMGSRTGEPERRLALETSQNYASAAKPPIDSSSITYMYEGHETAQFKTLFHGWEEKSKLDVKTLAGSGLVKDLIPQYSATFPLAAIKDRANLPPTVDQSKLEYHLDPKDFQEALKMSYDAYFALPEWKRLETKKSSPIY